MLLAQVSGCLNIHSSGWLLYIAGEGSRSAAAAEHAATTTVHPENGFAVSAKSKQQ